MTHQCPINACDKQVPKHMLMCPTHWWLVPTNLKADVNREFRAGKGSVAHLAACAAAVKAVNEASAAPKQDKLL